jgi:two-component system sensor histidine kinase AlgZ
MHPIFASASNLLLYLAACVPLGAMLGVLLSTAGRLSWFESACIALPLTLVAAFVFLSPWYVCRGLPLSSTSPWTVLAHHLVPAVVCTGALLLFARLLASGLSHFFPELDRRFGAATPVLTGVVLLIYLLSTAAHYAGIAIQSSREAELLARDAELKALKSQINPHFLFNSLNSISALTAIDAVRARDMCIRLSEFLRHSLRLGERTAIPFGEEIALARMYLDVEQVRFGSKLRVTQDIDPACDTCEVPPLLIQPLIENAVKHGVAMLADGGDISIVGLRDRDGIQFTVQNSFDPEAPATRKDGIGLVNVRSRLRARYGNAARLDIQVEPDSYRVSLFLPI